MAQPGEPHKIDIQIQNGIKLFASMLGNVDRLKDGLKWPEQVPFLQPLYPWILLGPYRLLACWRDSPWCGGGDQVRRFENDSDELTTDTVIYYTFTERLAENQHAVAMPCSLPDWGKLLMSRGRNSYNMRRIDGLWPDGFRCKTFNQMPCILCQAIWEFHRCLGFSLFGWFLSQKYQHSHAILAWKTILTCWNGTSEVG